jgi:hypothetical protein
VDWGSQSPPTWLLSDLEKAMNDAGFPTPNGLSYVEEVIYTHTDSGELIEMNEEAQLFAYQWIEGQNAG